MSSLWKVIKADEKLSAAAVWGFSFATNYFDWKENLCYSSWYSWVFYSFFSIAAQNICICWTNSHSSRSPLYCRRSTRAGKESCPDIPFFCLACLHLLPQFAAAYAVLSEKFGQLKRSKYGTENYLAFFFFFLIFNCIFHPPGCP